MRREGGMEACVVDRWIVLAQVSDLLTAGVSPRSPAEKLAAVCEVTSTQLLLRSAVLWVYVGGQSRTLFWRATGSAAATSLRAWERAWTVAAELLEQGSARVGDDDTAVASFCAEPLGLWAMLYVESRRRLDGDDRELLGELLRRLMGSAHYDSGADRICPRAARD